MGARERRKGKRGELEVCALLQEYGIRARRGAPMQAGGDRGDQVLPDVMVDGPFWLEVKRGKRVNIRQALRQALEDCPGGQVPLVVHRDDGGEWMVTGRLEDVLDQVAEVLERTEVIR